MPATNKTVTVVAMADDNELDIKRDPANPRVLFYKYNESFGTIDSLSINGIDMTPQLPNCFSVKSGGSCTLLVPESEYLAELNIKATNMWGGIAGAILPEIDQLEPVIPDPLDAIFGLHVYDWILVLIVILIMLVLTYKVLKKFLLTNY